MADLKRRIIAEFSPEYKKKGEIAAFRRDIDLTGQTMKRMAMGALAAVGGIYALQRGFRAMIGAAMEQEKAERALMAAIGENISKYKDYAAEMQKQTIYGDELIIQQMAYGANLGVTTGKLKEATKAAIGLAAKYRLDLSAAMMLVGRASQGQTQMLTRYGIILDANLSNQEKFNEILRRGADAFHLAKAEAETAAGTWEQFKNAIGDVAEELGGPFLDYATIALRQILELRREIEKPISFPYPPDKLKKEFKYLERKKAALGPVEVISPGRTEAEIEAYKKYLELRGKHYPTVPAGKPDFMTRFPEVIHFEEPEWEKNILALNKTTEAQEKAGRSMYEMMMKARGLSDELAREKQITEFAALAKEHYGADVEGAQAAVKRFTEALKESDMAKLTEAEKEAVIKDTKERIDAVRHMDYATRMERIQNLQAYVAANKEALEKVLAANKLIQDELKALELSKLYELRRWGRDASNIWMQIDQIAVKSLDSTADALTNMCLQGKADFRALAQSIIFDITRMMIKMQMAQLLGIGGAGGSIPAWFSGLGGAAGGLLGGGGGVGYTPTRYSAGAGTMYQEGGIATRPHLAMIGEVPEAFVPLSGGRSIPVEMRGGTGAANLDVHIHNEGEEKFEVSQAAEYWAGDQRVVDIFITRAQTDGRLRRAIKNAAK